MPLAHFKSKRIAAASRGFLAAALPSCLHAVIRNTASVLVSH